MACAAAVRAAAGDFSLHMIETSVSIAENVRRAVTFFLCDDCKNPWASPPNYLN